MHDLAICIDDVGTEHQQRKHEGVSLSLIALLRQIEKSSRQRVRMSRILCALALAAVLCCCLTFGVVYSLVPQANAVLTQTQTVLDNLESTTQQLAALTSGEEV